VAGPGRVGYSRCDAEATRPEFDKLSTERKAAYLATAVQAWKTGTPIATPNGEFDEEGSLD
jgi:hypothetical protein